MSRCTGVGSTKLRDGWNFERILQQGERKQKKKKKKEKNVKKERKK